MKLAKLKMTCNKGKKKQQTTHTHTHTKQQHPANMHRVFLIYESWITIYISAKVPRYLYRTRGDEVKLLCSRSFHGSSCLFSVVFSVFLSCSRRLGTPLVILYGLERRDNLNKVLEQRDTLFESSEALHTMCKRMVLHTSGDLSTAKFSRAVTMWFFLHKAWQPMSFVLCSS